jgi:hypothetical protein
MLLLLLLLQQQHVTSPNCLPPLEANICRWNYKTRLI